MEPTPGGAGGGGEEARPALSAAARPLVPRWAIHRRLYDWMLSFAHSKYATLALVIFSFTEAIFFPIPPFVLQIPLTLERRAKAWWYAGVTTVASVAGGLVGYWVGGRFKGFAARLFGESAIHKIDEYTQDVWLMTAGVLAIHPYKLFTIAAGFVDAKMGTFIVASLIGRAGLFFGLGALLWFFGPPIRVFIEKYFNWLTIAFGVLIIGLVVGMKML